MTITPEILAQLMPLAIRWARDGEETILRFGRELREHENADARLAGVGSPERIRVSVVPRIPRLDDGPLGHANRQIGLVTDQTGGLTLNYGIFVRADCAGDRELLFHEFVHVAQDERLGGFEGFLPRYLEECVRFGYPDAPMEREAVEMTARNIRR